MSKPTTCITPDAIGYRAYVLWQKEGQPAGRDQEFWLRAEKELQIDPPDDPPPASTGSATKPCKPATGARRGH